ncbi:Hypothetical protein R9X50_00538200 [Acrodontium crateriforme]|uniref:Bromo domain-containing protein n=1 Tax=Acrodontium crateriforme TaxID=150365 RepID=A0AAQ3M604_9PEZI|nr:Hypothetical protein R9X50_00538200 [Acrodontium crateriforme]
MDGARKRKQPNATPPPYDGSASKKLKLVNPNRPSASKSNVLEVGKRLVEQLRRASDKTGRPIATAFLTLPPRDELPDYYDFIKLPIAVDTIEKKLQNNGYPTLTTLESDFKRLVQNAKDYNAPKSEIYEDAERIRKLVYNFMKVNNPAYQQDPTYSSFPTPIPISKSGNVTNGNHESNVNETPKSRPAIERPHRPAARRSEVPSERKVSIAPSTGAENEDEDDVDVGKVEGETDFTGKSFIEAQQLLVQELINYADEEGLQIYLPFVNLPTRRLEDYYKLIRHPLSLNQVAKRARGEHGRNPPTGVSDFKTWEQFEDEVSFIWRNAREYNEDGSDMFILAGEFENHFKRRLADAKAKAEPPAGPRIKLGGPKPKVTLNLSQHRESSSTSGVTVDNEALARQRRMVQAGVDGQHGAAPVANGVANARSQTPVLDPTRPQSAHTGSPGIKPERPTIGSPAPGSLASVPPLINGTMAPPSIRPQSGSPFPQQFNSYTFTAPASLPPAAVRKYPASDALLPTVTLSTHPQLKLPAPLSISISPHPTLASQSTVFTLPSTHAYVQISPTINKTLSMGRPYKLFVTVNGARLNQRDTQFHAESGRRTHVYEGSLAPGVNRIEIEVAAAKPNFEEKGLDVEKVTVFANLMR